MIKKKEMTDGLVIIEGPVNDGNSALDYNGTFTVSGGTLLALGSSGMAIMSQRPLPKEPFS